MHIAKLCTNLCIEEFELKTIECNIIRRPPIGSCPFTSAPSVLTRKNGEFGRRGESGRSPARGRRRPVSSYQTNRQKAHSHSSPSTDFFIFTETFERESATTTNHLIYSATATIR